VGNLFSPPERVIPTLTHVAIIMDGNGRWARKRNLPRLAGHRAGTDNIRRVVDEFIHQQVKYLTLYTFSTENWNRPEEEVQGLINLFGEIVDRETEYCFKKGVRLRHLGSLEGLTKWVRERIQRAVEITKGGSRITLSLAFNYGGRAEILNAMRKIVSDGIKPENITEELFAQYLYITDIPEPDLIIRTGGEMRLSNFLIWQSAYSEYYLTPTLWPDFGEEDIKEALLSYKQRERRFGAA
jgi:undecaprenyl diphosphate synthase